MKVYAQWLEYPTGQGAYGSGGWSRNAKRRPAPVLKEVVGDAELVGKAWIIGGVRKLKCNLWALEDGRLLKQDYPDYKAPEWLSEPLQRSVMMAQASPAL